MTKLHFRYEMKIEYSVPVAKCNFTIKCIPKDSKRQLIDNIQISLTPRTGYNFGKDGFSNTQIYGSNDADHKLFIFVIEGDATTGLSDYETDSQDIDMVFRHSHGLNLPGQAIRAYYETRKRKPDTDAYEWALQTMHDLHEVMTYEPDSTTNKTTAEEAFSQKKGVCQDYAHIYIALMQLAGIPARYVTGLIVGEGASHAWVEIQIGDRWYGLDPTNDQIVKEEHIRIGMGRDANDCQINRGIMHGGGLHVQTIKADVNREMEQ